MPLAALPDNAAPLLEWAQWYASYGWAVFPCHGKRPITTRGLHDATCDATQIAQWWSQWPEANIGHPLDDHHWALDVDARHDGLDTLRELEDSYGPLPRTVTSLTGSGGGSHHQLWASATPIQNKAKLGPGLDVQGPGSYIILPPSIHPATKQPYQWEADYGPDDLALEPAPSWLLALVTEATAPLAHGTKGTTPQPEAPILEGEREHTLMRLAGAMRRQGANFAIVRAALEVANQRCTPALLPADLDRMAQSVQRYAPAPAGWSVNGVQGDTITAGISAAWRKALFAKKNGELTQNVFNINTILASHAYWQQPEHTLWWDSVRGRPMCGEAELTDDLLMDIASWFGGAERLPITSPRLLEQCVLAACKKHPRDLLQLWLNSLPGWDGVPRLDSWLTTIAGAPATEYTTNISRGLLVSMVARALHPGCHYRFVVIFEGVEELGKSSLVRALASPEWYVDLSIGLETKEAHMMLQGVWVAEFSELDSLSRTEETRLKAFITMREDSFIPKYSNFRQRTERRAIFIGTTNEESYLKGQSGNTRYVPIRLTQQIDLERFTAMRAQLFAEALHYYHGHQETWWQFSDEALETAREERDQRRIWQIYEDPLHEWLEYSRFAEVVYDDGLPVKFVQNETSWPEIARWFLKLDSPEKWKDRGLQIQIAAALKALGWHVGQVWRNGRNRKIWQKETPEVPF